MNVDGCGLRLHRWCLNGGGNDCQVRRKDGHEGLALALYFMVSRIISSTTLLPREMNRHVED